MFAFESRGLLPRNLLLAWICIPKITFYNYTWIKTAPNEVESCWIYSSYILFWKVIKEHSWLKFETFFLIIIRRFYCEFLFIIFFIWLLIWILQRSRFSYNTTSYRVVFWNVQSQRMLEQYLRLYIGKQCKFYSWLTIISPTYMSRLLHIHLL